MASIGLSLISQYSTSESCCFCFRAMLPELFSSTNSPPWQMDLCAPSTVIAKRVFTSSLCGKIICCLLYPHKCLFPAQLTPCFCAVKMSERTGCGELSDATTSCHTMHFSSWFKLKWNFKTSMGLRTSRFVGIVWCNNKIRDVLLINLSPLSAPKHL